MEAEERHDLAEGQLYVI